MTMGDWPLTRRIADATTDGDGRVLLAFEREYITLPLTAIVALKPLREGVRESRKFTQIVSSVKAIGLVEAPVVVRDRKQPEQYLLLDGHLRLEALRDLGIETVECLVATEEETYTYNKRVNRLPPIQEHRMVARSIERGVPATAIAEALGMEVGSVQRRFRLLNGICPDAVEMLKDTNCPMKVFDILRRMSSIRQIEAADFMLGQNNFTPMFAQAILAATPEDQFAAAYRKAKPQDGPGPTRQQIERMERELAALQTQVKAVEETYGLHNLHLTVAKGYIARLLANARVLRWLSQHHHEYLTEFQKIAEIETLAAATS
jgi:hypothetical protein